MYTEISRYICQDCVMGNAYDLVKYEVNGCFIDYAYSTGAFSLAVELGHNKFHPFKGKESIIEKHKQSWVHLFLRALPFLKLKFA